MIRNGFMKIFWGLLFILLDIRIGGIDFILPDFVGYILIASGLGILSPIHPRFAKARTFALIMIFLSLADIVELKQVISQHGNVTFWVNALFPITTIGAILDLIMVWNICGGIIELSFGTGNPLLATVATTRRNLYIALAVIAWCCMGFFYIEPQLVSVFIIPLVIFSLIVMCLIMGLMKKAAEELDIKQNDASNPSLSDK